MTMFALWHALNQHVMEGKRQKIQEISTKSESFIREMDEIKLKLLEKKVTMKSQWLPPQSLKVRVNFDVAFKPDLH
ncbi:hypothetical protein CXB51_025663 [Gossypium anomalum]|uniref:Uncharacterized protein n=1 Tax=Gossypium anomalum TaxID=47600 RepID=A0A8J5Y3H1_9ROSI|nr:hypothetical protein CXB51_025663 [Gossypium anomalum]